MRGVGVFVTAAGSSLAGLPTVTFIIPQQRNYHLSLTNMLLFATAITDYHKIPVQVNKEIHRIACTLKLLRRGLAEQDGSLMAPLQAIPIDTVLDRLHFDWKRTAADSWSYRLGEMGKSGYGRANVSRWGCICIVAFRRCWRHSTVVTGWQSASVPYSAVRAVRYAPCCTMPTSLQHICARSLALTLG